MPEARRDAPFCEDAADEVVLVITDGGGYNDTVKEITTATLARFPAVAFFAANRPHDAVRRSIGEAAADLRFIDCITSMTGVMPEPVEGVVFIESPTLLEKALLRAQQMLRRMEGDRCLVVDSLSTLAVYNGERAVAELCHHLITRLRLLHIAAALVVVETQAEEGLIATVGAHCDRVVRL